jgi:DNA-directed RNA polymerase specialized sigma24 family protein
MRSIRLGDTFLESPSLLDVSLCAPAPDAVPRFRLAPRGAGGKMPANELLEPLMATRPSSAGRWTASAGFARLLERLDPDPDRAAAAYERLRLALEKFFDWHGAWPPEECADETIDRLAVKLAGGIQIDDLRGYARGIARLVLLEWRRRPVPMSIDDRTEPAAPPPHAVDEERHEGLLTCFDRCLAALPDESRTLVLAYYVAERREKIDNRRRLARGLGLSESGLRNRVQRLRDRLERCVETCTEASR